MFYSLFFAVVTLWFGCWCLQWPPYMKGRYLCAFINFASCLFNIHAFLRECI